MKLRDISEMTCQCNCAYLQKKISLAGEMKTSIKRFLDWWEFKTEDDTTKEGVKRVSSLKKAMEDYLNCEP